MPLGGGLLGGIGGGVVGGASVRLFLDDRQFKAGLASAKAQTAEASGAMGKFAGAAKTAFLGASVAAGAFAVVAVGAYSKHQQILAQLQQTIGRMPGLEGETTAAFERQGEALQNLTGYTKDEVLAADNVLARFQLTGDQIRQLMPLVLDYARATGQDVATAATGLGRAMLGNTRALKTIGINFKATGDTAKDFATIMGLLQAKVSGVATTFGKTAAGQLDIAKAKFHEVAIAAGKELTPILTSLLQSVVKGAEAFGQWAAANPKLVETLGAVTAAVLLLSGALGPIALTVAAIVTAFAGLGTISQDAKINAASFHNLAMEVATGKMTVAEYDRVVGNLVDKLPSWAKGDAAVLYSHQHLNDAIRQFHERQTRANEVTDRAVEISGRQQQAQNVLNAEWGAANLQLTRYTGALADWSGKADTSAQAMAKAKIIIASATAVLGDQGAKLKDVQSAWQDWRDSAEQNLNFVSGALGDFSGKAHVSIGKVITDFQKNRTEMKQFATDLESIRQRGGKAAAGLVASLLNMGDQGVGVAHAIASANESQFGKVLGIWDDTANKAHTFANEITQAIVGPMNRVAAAFLVAAGKAPNIAAALLIVEGRARNAAQAIAILQNGLTNLQGTYNVNVVTTYHTVGQPAQPGKQLP